MLRICTAESAFVHTGARGRVGSRNLQQACRVYYYHYCSPQLAAQGPFVGWQEKQCASEDCAFIFACQNNLARDVGALAIYIAAWNRIVKSDVLELFESPFINYFLSTAMVRNHFKVWRKSLAQSLWQLLAMKCALHSNESLWYNNFGTCYKNTQDICILI